VLDGELLGGDDAFGLVTDVEQDLVVVDLDHGAGDDVAIVEVLDGRVDCGEEFLRATDVVDGYLGCVGSAHKFYVLRKNRRSCLDRSVSLGHVNLQLGCYRLACADLTLRRPPHPPITVGAIARA